MSALGPPTDTPRHTPAESHPCEPTENIWVGESKPAALACAEAAWEQSSLEHLSTPGPNHTSAVQDLRAWAPA